jgi:uncharacterized protein (DUF1697 family)
MGCMAHRFIAFLRAVNVGGHTVKMDYLRRLFGEMGFSSVETFIASGNVIFETDNDDTPALEKTIAAGLEAALGYPVATFIRTPAELAAVAARWPFDPAERDTPHTLFIGFLADPPGEAARARLLACATEVDTFHIDGREVYWLRRDAVGKSKITGAVLEKALGQAATVRNGRTVGRVAKILI